jgi:two-component system nitrogen regulation response regulator GlnG
LFLDEVDSLPLSAQAKLLRFLEAGEYRAVGSDRVGYSDAWVIAATNRDLDQWCERGRFRRDLMYRLSVVTIPIPSLAERRQDISLLAHHFLEQATGPGRRFSASGLRALCNHDWPGNIRELKHRVEAAALFSETESIGPPALGLEDVADEDLATDDVAPAATLPDLLWRMVDVEQLSLQQVLVRCELLLLQRALGEGSEGRNDSARRLGIHVRTLFKKLALLRGSVEGHDGDPRGS